MVKHKANLGLLILTGVLLISSCKPTPEEAIAYNDQLTALQKSIDLKEQALVSSLYEKNIAQIERAHMEFMGQVKDSKKELAEIKSFDNNDSYSNAMSKLIDTYQQVGEKEYAEIINIIRGSVHDSINDTGQADKLLDAANNKLNKALDNAATEQEKFARKYDIEVDEESN